MGMMQKPIEGYEDYIAYENGSIYSLKSNKFLKPVIHKNGYASVTLWHKGKGKQVLIHKIIALSFLPNPNNFPEVDHIDCNPLNNDLSNLKWISREDNLKRSFDLKHQRFNKKPVQQFDLNGKLIAIYESQCEAFRQTHIRHIAEVARGERKTAGGYIWKNLNEGSDDLSEEIYI